MMCYDMGFPLLFMTCCLMGGYYTDTLSSLDYFKDVLSELLKPFYRVTKVIEYQGQI
jgi:hypothetical protein